MMIDSRSRIHNMGKLVKSNWKIKGKKKQLPSHVILEIEQFVLTHQQVEYGGKNVFFFK